jgi:hypothetical protein
MNATPSGTSPPSRELELNAFSAGLAGTSTAAMQLDVLGLGTPPQRSWKRL